MSKEKIETIKKLYETFNQRDYEMAREMLHPAMEWYAADNSPLADKTPYIGIESVMEDVFGRLKAGFETLTIRVDDVFAADDDRVIVLGYYEGIPAHNKKEFTAQAAHIWTFNGARPAKFQQYVDTHAILSAVK